jgi:hypothetical protein
VSHATVMLEGERNQNILNSGNAATMTECIRYLTFGIPRKPLRRGNAQNHYFYCFMHGNGIIDSTESHHFPATMSAPTHVTESINDRKKSREIAEARQNGAMAPEVDVSRL